MVTFRDFLEPGTRNDVIIQQSLRDIDGEVLVVAFFGMAEDERAMVLRNMSKRANEMILDDFHAMEKPSEGAARAACAHFLGLLSRHASEYVEGSFTKPVAPPAVDFSTADGVIAGFVDLERFALANGLLALESCLGSMTEPVARKGLQLVIEGMDPLLLRSILDDYKKACLRDLETRLELLITGVESVAQRDNPFATEQRLKALVGRL